MTHNGTHAERIAAADSARTARRDALGIARPVSVRVQGATPMPIGARIGMRPHAPCGALAVPSSDLHNASDASAVEALRLALDGPMGATLRARIENESAARHADAVRAAVRMRTAVAVIVGTHDAGCDADGARCRCAGTRVTVEASRAIGLPDRASMVGPVLPVTFGATSCADAVWCGLAPLTANIGPWVLSILTRIAYGHGRTDVPRERLDDIRQDALVSSHAALSALASDSGSYPVRSCDIAHDDACDCPNVAGVIGYLVVRASRCRACDGCDALGALSPWAALSSCEAPVSAVDYVTVRRALARALYRESARALRSAKMANLRDNGDPSDALATSDGSDALAILPDALATAVRAALAACELAGIGVAGHGVHGVSADALSMLALAMGHAPTPAGRRAALVKARAML